MPCLKSLLVTSLALIVLNGAAEATIPTGEREALLTLYQSTGGNGWVDNSGWLGSVGSECSWYGVTCDEGETAVVDIALWSNGLVGTIPSSIGDFSALRGLALAANDLTGPIPSSIGNLGSLVSLNLQENRLTGEIPSALGSLTNLEEIHLFDNELTGPIPASLGQLGALRMLTLGNNGLSGFLPPELGSLSSMEYLDLGGLQLSGPIPTSFGQMSNLDYLNLESSGISGLIPPELGLLFALESLHLSYNMLSGAIPPELEGLTSIEELYLTANRLTGPIPGELTTLSTLRSLTLDSNQLSGTIPATIDDLVNLEYLSLGYNQLSGTIPADLGRLANLTYLDMPGNRFSGVIPPELADATALTYIDLSGNEDDETGTGGLTGQIPVRLGELENLRVLELSHNDLDGAIPSQLGNVPNLEWLGIAENRLSGTIPDSLANLSKLQWISAFGNQLEGPVPLWLGELGGLKALLLGNNSLTGGIPAGITTLVELETLDLCGNFITGPIPPDIGKLNRLEYLTFCENDFSGPIPDGIWTLENLIELRLEDNQLSGVIPPEIANLSKVEVLLLGDNQIEGTIPNEIAELQSVTVLGLDGNRLTGSIPAAIGDLTQLEFLGLGHNALRGLLPRELMNLANLTDDGLRIGFNALFTSDSELRAFVNDVHENEPFELSQTVAPTDVTVGEVTDRSARVTWSPILYIHDEGGYEVMATPTAGGAAVIATTLSKEITSTTLRGLEPGTGYTVTVKATTHPHGYQQNFIRSEASAAVSLTTTSRVTSPASVAIVSRPGGLIQIGGVPQNTTSYTIVNFGDVATAITLDQDGGFFTQEPESFTLGAGGSQIVTVSSVPGQAPDSYWGWSSPRGEGAPEDLFVTIQLLAVDEPEGQPRAEASTSRIELSGDFATDAIGTVTFRNVGTIGLRGILISDVGWIETPAELIEIGPGELRNINFTVRRSRRPDVALGSGGTLLGSIRLVYLGQGSAASLAKTSPSDETTSVTQTLVTVVDTVRPPVAASTIPILGVGETMLVIPGATTGDGSVTDLFVTNSFGTSALTDLRIFFRPLSGSNSSVATPGTVAPSGSLVFSSVLDSVFSSQAEVGSLLVRTKDSASLLVNALRSENAVNSSRALETIPVFRSNRSLAAGGTVHFAGTLSGGTHSTTLFVQEVGGAEVTSEVDAWDAAGNRLGERIVLGPIEPFGLLRHASFPAGTASLSLSTDDESAGQLVAWALVSDKATGQSWAVADWNQVYGMDEGESRRVPLVLSEGSSSRRQRPVRRPHRDPSLRLEVSNHTPMTTTLTLFNSGNDDAAMRLTLWDGGMSSDRLVAIDPGQTVAIADVASYVRGGNSGSRGYLVATPLRGRLALSARSHGRSPDGSSISMNLPVIPAGTGLRLGQTRTFTGLEDSSRETIAARIAGTTSTGFGIAEVAGKSVTVRATLRLPSGVLAGVTVMRDFVVGAHETILLDPMARAILGEQRETRLGDLRNLQLELRVIGGEGAASVFVITRDNRSGDPVFRLE